MKVWLKNRIVPLHEGNVPFQSPSWHVNFLELDGTRV